MNCEPVRPFGQHVFFQRPVKLVKTLDKTYYFPRNFLPIAKKNLVILALPP
jgi:hypothetical protein